MAASNGVFLKVGESLVLLEPQPYASEDVLQKALEQYPEVLAGPTTTNDEPTRLALVKREQPISDTPDGAGRWSLDHLFVDSHAVPVLVEVKRSSDTRIRREVIGQMLEYAANGLRHWRTDSLREAFRTTCQAAGQDEEAMFDALGSDQPVDTFWQTVADNLGSGRVRLLFVADRLPDELVHVIEFLNERMTPTEVLGVELRQYVGGPHDEHVMYVPRVIGRTTTAVDRKQGPEGVAWNRETLTEEASRQCSPEEQKLIDRLLDRVQEGGGRLTWSKAASPGVGGWHAVDGTAMPTWFLRIRPDPPGGVTLEWHLGSFVTRIGPERTSEVAQTLAQIPALTAKIEEARQADWNKWPSVTLADVLDSGHAETVFSALDSLEASQPR